MLAIVPPPPRILSGLSAMIQGEIHHVPSSAVCVAVARRATQCGCLGRRRLVYLQNR
jgi:hypothetical protein